MEQVVIKYLKALNIPISRKYVKKLIATHPDYPSMLSIADTLERLGIRYKATRMEKERLGNIEHPFLLWPTEQSRQPKIVRDERDLSLDGTENQSLKDSGQPIVLLAEPTDTIRDKENNRQRSQDRFLRILTGVLVVAAAALFLLVALASFTWMYTPLFITALAGTVIGYLLIAKDIGISYQPVEAFCRAGEKTNCDAVLNSEGANLIGDKVTFSDAAISYFLFQLIAVSFLLPSARSLSGILAVMSGLTIPVIGYSLYYQAFSVKTWCRLCLLVDGILAVQAILFGYMYYNGFIAITDITLQPLVQAGLLFLATASAVLLLKNKIKVANQSEQDTIEAGRIKYSPEVFMYLLRRKNRVDITPFKQELLIGDSEAPMNILIAASLGCGPCKTGFEKATQLVTAYPKKVSLTVRLRTGDRNNGELTPGRYLLNYWQQHIHGKPGEPARTEQLLQDWYAGMDLKAFREKYPADGNEIRNTGTQLSNQHTEWFEAAEIEGTPTFFVNGRRLPMTYRIEDLMGMVPALVGGFVKKNIQQNESEIDFEEFVSVRKHPKQDKEGD